MIYEKIGNILEQTDASYICHQVKPHTTKVAYFPLNVIIHT